MSTSLPTSDFDAFYAFLGELRLSSTPPISAEESLQRFRESQEKLRRFQRLNEVAADQSRRGLSTPLDIEALLERVEQRVAQQEISQ